MLKLLLASLIIALNVQPAAPIEKNAAERQTDLRTQSENVLPNTQINLAQWSENNLLQAPFVPTKDHSMIAPIIKAKAGLAMDVNSATVLFEKNAHTPLPIASITKLMTAIIIIERHTLEEIVTVGKNPQNVPGSRIWLAEGEKITVKNLLYGLLIPSGNDAALALAEYDSGTEEIFVQLMNQKAKLLGLKQTTFINATGLDQEHQNVSTAYEIALLSMYALKSPFIRETVQIQTMEIKGENFGTHKLETTNKLLGKELGIKGLKTGNTDAAGPSFVALTDTPLKTDLITVVLNSEQRFTDTNILIYWINRAYTWK